ncbi:ATP12 family chaperone protein [Sphingomonas colocasiae]|uniref:ATPase n=1 Tax=Sphingomonas colocasiae TaxID=1848973 RepID=A0ABS7PUK5_9SPHN|nr:ATP12 family protein [Sphingomonas colocasiae]MBY8824883.1 ATPase [Sphingomonas colocasiae]
MKRFYTSVSVTSDGGIALDGRPVRTPGRAPLVAPTAALADAIAREWAEQGDQIDPRSMRFTGLSNAAIDRVAPDPETFARGLSVYGESDLLCYRAESPETLVARQAAAWDPLLAWAATRYDVAFTVATGIVHRPQPDATLDRLTAATVARDPFALVGLSPLVTISGSLVTALAVAEEAVSPDAAWLAITVDEAWQAERWGEDTLAAQALEARRVEFIAAASFLSLLR